MNSSLLRIVVVAFAAFIIVLPAEAQQRGRGRDGAQRPRPGLEVPPLPTEPIVYKTGAHMDIRVVVVARNLEHPWSLAFLPDGDILVTENPGRLRLIHDGKLLPDPIAGVPEAGRGFLQGLLDVKLHPDFAENRLVYLTYDKPMEGGNELAVARGKFDGRALTDVEDIFIAHEANSVSRMLFAPDGKLYVSVYGAESGNDPQDPMQYDGKILRLNYDGSVPDDNPFVGRKGYLPEIYTMGHRSPEGLVWHEGRIWEVEMGPNGGDEINILQAGGNYGWPLVSLGRTYQGPWQSRKFNRDEMIDPVVYWMPSISTSGLAFYTGDKLAAWKGNAFVGGVRYGEIAGTGQLQRIVFNDDMQELRREVLLADLRRRIRDVRQGPDELLYLLTDETDGALLRIEPAD
jgi:glucose/arabinose dehydrogenase